MATSFYTNSSEVKFINKLCECIDHCTSFCFSASFIKKPGLKLIAPNIKAALERGAKGQEPRYPHGAGDGGLLPHTVFKTKNDSYYRFLRAIDEDDLPSFDTRQVALIRFASDMLPIVRPYEYLILQSLLDGAGSDSLANIERHLRINVENYKQEAFEHALTYMKKHGFVRSSPRLVRCRSAGPCGRGTRAKNGILNRDGPHESLVGIFCTVEGCG